MASSKSKIRILICSSNLGNAQPDVESLNAWIPLDGLCQHVGLPPIATNNNNTNKDEEEKVEGNKSFLPRYPVLLKAPPPPVQQKESNQQQQETKSKKSSKAFIPPLSPMKMAQEKEEKEQGEGGGATKKKKLQKQPKQQQQQPREISFCGSEEEVVDPSATTTTAAASAAATATLMDHAGSSSSSSSDKKKKKKKKDSSSPSLPSPSLPSPSVLIPPSSELLDAAANTIALLNGGNPKEKDELGDSYSKFLAAKDDNSNTSIPNNNNDNDNSLIKPDVDPKTLLTTTTTTTTTEEEEEDAYEAFLASQAQLSSAAVSLGDDPYAPVPLGDDPYAPVPLGDDPYAPAPLGDDPYAPAVAVTDLSDDDDEYAKFLASQAAAPTVAVSLGEDPYAPSSSSSPPPSPKEITVDDVDDTVQQQQQQEEEERDQLPDEEDSDYAAFLESQKKKTLWGFMEAEEDKLSASKRDFFYKDKDKEGDGIDDDDDSSSGIGGGRSTAEVSILTDGFRPSNTGVLEEAQLEIMASLREIDEANTNFANFAEFDNADMTPMEEEGRKIKDGATQTKEELEKDPFQSTHDISTTTTTTTSEDKDRFDIIIIGMQEATFQADKQEGVTATPDLFDDEGDPLFEIEDDDSLEGSVESSSENISNHIEEEPLLEDAPVSPTLVSPPSSTSTKASATKETKKVKGKKPSSGDSSVASTATTATTNSSTTATTSGGGDDGYGDDSKISKETGKKSGITGKLFKTADKMLSSKSAISATKAATKALKVTGKVGKGAGKLTLKASVKSAKLTGTVVGKSAKLTGTVVGKGAKVGMKGAKATMKAGKAAKILTLSKDHTAAETPSPQQMMAPIMDGGGMAEWGDTDILHYLLEDQLPSYKRAVSWQQGEMRLIMYYRESAIDLDVLSVKAQNTGMGGLANKGGIVTEVTVNKTTRLAFGTAHLEAHEGQEKYATRCASVADILRGTKSAFTSVKYDAAMANHFMFFMGDLNFRTKLNDYEPGSFEHVEATHKIVGSKSVEEEMRKKAEKEKEKEKSKVKKEIDDVYDKKEADAEEEELEESERDLSPLNHVEEVPDDPPPSCYYILNQADELAYALRIKDCFVGWKTPYCNFPPTFKVGRQLGYKYNPKRSPSYTDRILYKTSDQLESALTPILYEPVANFTSSDHKPIRGAYEIELNPKLQLKPNLPTSRESERESSLVDIDNKLPPPSLREPPPASLNVFVSSIKCSIYTSEYTKTRGKGETPSPFVCFVSNPREAIRTGVSKWESMFRKVGIHTLKTTKTKNKDDEANVVSRTMGGWPRTKKLDRTFAPEWGDGEETLFKVRTQGPDGGQLDLSGAMLHITVMDGKVSGEPRLVGSFTLNLARLLAISGSVQDDITVTQQSTSVPIGWSKGEGPSAALTGAVRQSLPSPVRKAAESVRNSQTPSDVPGVDTVTTQSRNGPHRSSSVLTSGPSAALRGVMHKEAIAVMDSPELASTEEKVLGDEVDDGLDRLKVVSLKLDEVLVEGGVEVGQISCNIDAWWMVEESGQP